MNRTELEELIRIGENSGVEFKRDDVVPERLAKELAALLNQEGGHLLLGVEDDGTVSGLTRAPKQVEERIMEIARMHLRPAAIPFWENLKLDDGNVVGVISLPADAPDKPYKAKRGTAWVTQVRVGTTTRDATDAEEARLYMQSGHLQYDRKPVSGATFGDLDLRRLVNYFRDLRQQGAPEDTDLESWLRLLVTAWIENGGRRLERWDYPLEAVREALIKEVLRDDRYIEATGLGVPRRIIKGMHAHNGTEPDLTEEDDRFLVRLWKEARS